MADDLFRITDHENAKAFVVTRTDNRSVIATVYYDDLLTREFMEEKVNSFTNDLNLLFKKDGNN